MILHLLTLDSFPLVPLVFLAITFYFYFTQKYTNPNDSNVIVKFGNYPNYYIDYEEYSIPPKNIIDPKTGVVSKWECPLTVTDDKIKFKGKTYTLPHLFKIDSSGLMVKKLICDADGDVEINWDNLTLYYNEKYHTTLKDTFIDGVLKKFIFNCKDGVPTLIKK